MQNNNNFKYTVGAIVVLSLVFGYQYSNDNHQLNNDSSSHVEVHTRNTNLQGILSDVSREDKKKLAQLWADEGYVIENDEQNIIKTTGDVRTVNNESGVLSAMGLKGKYNGLPEAVDKYIMESLGDDNIELTPELRKKAANVFYDLSEMAGGV